MKLFYCLFLSAILCPFISIAQTNFKPGYVVTVKGDTLKGTIDYREWDSNPKTVNFKTGGNSATKSLSPADITYFNIDNLETYQSYNGQISRDETVEDKIINGRDTSFFVDNVFLRVLQKGRVITLYGYTDAIKRRYFYSVGDSKNVQELIYRIYNDSRVVTATRGRTVIEATYLQQLTRVALDAGILDDKLQALLSSPDHNRPVLLNIVTKMNGLTKTDLNAKNADDRSNFDLYVGLGIHAMKTDPHGNYLAAGGKTYTSYLPKALVGFNAYANPNTRKLIFSIELSVAQAKYKSIYNNLVYPYQGILYNFNQTIVSVEPQITYNLYNADNFKFYATIGYDISRYFFGNEKFVRQDDGTDARYGLFPFSLHNGGNSVVYKAGVLIKKRFQIYGAYLSSNGISYDGYFSLSQSTGQIGVNYLLGKQK